MGRPAKHPKEWVRVTIAIAPALLAEVDAAADRMGLTRSEVVALWVARSGGGAKRATCPECGVRLAPLRPGVYAHPQPDHGPRP